MKVQIQGRISDITYPRLMQYGADKRVFLMLAPGKGIGFDDSDILYQEGLTKDPTYWKDFNGRLTLEN
jgi:hypothetical protein